MKKKKRKKVKIKNNKNIIQLRSDKNFQKKKKKRSNFVKYKKCKEKKANISRNLTTDKFIKVNKQSFLFFLFFLKQMYH